MKRLNIVLIGMGRIGQMHLKNISTLPEMYNVVGIADPYSDQLPALAKEYNVPAYDKDYKKLLDKGNVDCVLIASATNTHYEIIHEVASRHIDMICEKPIDTDIKRIKDLLKYVDQCGVKLQIGFNRRFDHNFAKIRQYVQKGVLGTPQIVKISSRDPQPPTMDYVKVSGGLFFDMMIHDLDLIRYLSGSEVEEVTAKGAVLVDPEIGKLGDIDTAIVTLRFKNGALGEIDNSRQAVYGYDQRAEVFGPKGMAKADNDRDSTVELDLKDDTSLDKMPWFFTDRYKQAYISELESFHDSIVEDKPLVVDGLDGLRAVQLAKACKESLDSGKTVKVQY